MGRLDGLVEAPCGELVPASEAASQASQVFVAAPGTYVLEP